MKTDQIIKNAKIFTADKNKLQATALVVKDGKFIYVGDETGLSAYEGEVTDLGGKFIMPGIIDSHVHVTTSIGFAYMDPGEYIFCSSKKEALDFMSASIKSNPGLKRYRFILELDEFDIHPAKESEVKIVDWDKTYFLTKYYML